MSVSLFLRKKAAKIAFAIMVIAIIIGKLSSPSDALEKTNLWYQGGTLHSSTAAEWNAASQENKLATCGDWAAMFNNTISMDVLRDRAGELLVCVDEAVKGVADSDEGVSLIAASCMMIMYE